MASKGQELGVGFDQSDSRDGDVQFIEAPKADQPRVLTPVRDAQMKPKSPAIPSWLSNSINKKRSLQPMSMPVKDIVNRYGARGCKAKKMKTDAQLIKYPLTGRITVEVATYKQKKESGDIDEEGLKVTSIELGTINKSIDNKIFKFSVDHMLTQSEKDTREKKELKAMVTAMAAYIDSLVNLGAVPVIGLPQPFDPNSTESQLLTRQV